MRRLRLSVITLLLLSAPCGVVQAGWGDWFHNFWAEARRNNAWPDPYRFADRQAAAAPFVLMKDNGWRLEHTLVDALFTPEGELTHAGKLKVQRIVRQAPLQRRSVWVLRAESPEMTDVRLQSVQQYVDSLALDGSVVPVFVTDFAPRGGTGDYLNQVSRKQRESIPPPVLPKQQQTTGSSQQ